MAKAWLRDRWDMLLPLLLPLGSADEEQIKQICEEEIAYFRARFADMSPVSLKEPMLDTRKFLKENLPLTDQNSYIDGRKGEKMHLALKYMNYSRDEWHSFNKPSEKKAQERREHLRFIDDPYEVVRRAESLLDSANWVDVAIGLAVVTGRRLEEVMKAGGLSPKSTYTAVFSGQLKRHDALLAPYEIPLLLPSGVVCSAWARLRSLKDCSNMEGEMISKNYGTELSAAAYEYFGSLVPEPEGRGLYFHCFRGVYACIAIHWFCPVLLHDVEYRPTILGQYWTDGEELKRDLQASLYYVDYVVSDGSGNRDGRQGIRLDEPGVKVLDVFDESEGQTEKKKGVRAMATPNKNLQLEGKGETQYSLYRPSKDTKLKLDKIQEALAKQRQVKLKDIENDDVLVFLLANNAIVESVQAVTTEELAGLLALLQEAAKDVAALQKEAQETGIATYTTKKHPIPVGPVAYLVDVLSDLREYRSSYDGRQKKTDYSTIKTSDLARYKTEAASNERLGRAVAAIMQYNDNAPMPEARWYIQASVLVDLVGGSPAVAKKYVDAHPEIAQHHKKYNLNPGINRRGIPITERVTVPELPVGAVPSESSEPEPVEVAE